ncbi:MAG: DUF2505 domain-containing protein [Myxococcales bacterium]|jgi:hypothetical protein|nr:DUF2505 domain-containing protein [Myxococcales bacterium]
MQYTITDDFDTSIDHYWDVYFDDAYNAELYRRLRIGREVLEVQREGEGEDLVVRRKVRLTPQREVPGIVSKFVKGALMYTEQNVFTRRTNTLEVVTIPGFMADKLTTRGTYKVQALGPNKVRRTWQGEVSCSIPLVGGKVERHIVDEVTAGYRDTTEFTRKWLQEHP